MRKSPKFSPEVMERAVRMVFDAKDQYPSQWAAIESIAGKIGCTAETRCASGYARASATAACALVPRRPSSSASRSWSARVRELRKTNEILKLASAYFAQAELDRHHKK